MLKSTHARVCISVCTYNAIEHIGNIVNTAHLSASRLLTGSYMTGDMYRAIRQHAQGTECDPVCTMQASIQCGGVSVQLHVVHAAFPSTPCACNNVEAAASHSHVATNP